MLNYKDFWKNRLVKKLTLVLVLLAVVSVINPHGIKGALLAFPLNIKGESPIVISEDISVFDHLSGTELWGDISVAIFMPLVILLAVSFLFNLKRKPIFYLMAGVATSVLAFLHLRGLALFGLIFLPAVSANFSYIFEKFNDFYGSKLLYIKNISEKILALIFVVVFLSAIFFIAKIGVLENRNFGVGLVKWSNEAGLFFKEQDIKGPIFNDADVGSYLIYHLYPKERVFVDNRFGDAYSPSFFRDIYLPMIVNEDVWKEKQEQYQFNSIFFYQYDAVTGGRAFLSRRMDDPEWALIYANTFNLIFIRNNEQNQDKIDEFHITKENASEKLSHLLESNRLADQVAGADILFLLGREDLAMSHYINIVTRWPDKDSIWMVMAQIELRKNGPQSSALAVMYLEKSLALGRKTAEVYSFLGLAYLRLEQLEKGKEMLKQALKINPERGDAKDFLRQLNERLEKEGITLK